MLSIFRVHSSVSSAAIKRAQKILQTPSGVYSYFLIFCSAVGGRKSICGVVLETRCTGASLADGFARKNKSAARRGVTFIIEVEHYAAL